jgi:hypothetical protein
MDCQAINKVYLHNLANISIFKFAAVASPSILNGSGNRMQFIFYTIGLYLRQQEDNQKGTKI